MKKKICIHAILTILFYFFLEEYVLPKLVLLVDEMESLNNQAQEDLKYFPSMWELESYDKIFEKLQNDKINGDNIYTEFIPIKSEEVAYDNSSIDMALVETNIESNNTHDPNNETLPQLNTEFDVDKFLSKIENQNNSSHEVPEVSSDDGDEEHTVVQHNNKLLHIISRIPATNISDEEKTLLHHEGIKFPVHSPITEIQKRKLRAVSRKLKARNRNYRYKQNSVHTIKKLHKMIRKLNIENAKLQINIQSMESLYKTLKCSLLEL